MKAHGGTINVSSIEGKGSAFTFTMPLLRAMGRESLEEGRNAAHRAAAAGGATKMIGGTGMSTTDTSSQVTGSTVRVGIVGSWRVCVGRGCECRLSLCKRETVGRSSDAVRVCVCACNCLP